MIRYAIQQLAQEMGGVLVAGYTMGNEIGVGDVVGKLDLETDIVETVGMYGSSQKLGSASPRK